MCGGGCGLCRGADLQAVNVPDEEAQVGSSCTHSQHLYTVQGKFAISPDPKKLPFL